MVIIAQQNRRHQPTQLMMKISNIKMSESDEYTSGRAHMLDANFTDFYIMHVFHVLI